MENRVVCEFFDSCALSKANIACVSCSSNRNLSKDESIMLKKCARGSKEELNKESRRVVNA